MTSFTRLRHRPPAPGASERSELGAGARARAVARIAEAEDPAALSAAALDGTFVICDGEQRVAEYRLRPASECWVRVPEHRRGLWEALQVEPRPLTIYAKMGHVHLLQRMKLEHLLAQIDERLPSSGAERLDDRGFLTRALEVEWQRRYQRGLGA